MAQLGAPQDKIQQERYEGEEEERTEIREAMRAEDKPEPKIRIRAHNEQLHIHVPRAQKGVQPHEHIITIE